MNIFLFVGLFLLLFLILVIIIFFFVFLLDSVLRGHDLFTTKRVIRTLIEIIIKNKPEAKNFYDLGCGRGTVVLEIKKDLPYLEVYGIDNSAIRIFFAKLKAKILGQKIQFKKQSISQPDLKNADVVYAYLWYDRMPLLEQKLRRELKPGALVITNTSNFPTWKSTQKIITHHKPSKLPDFETLFVYIK